MYLRKTPQLLTPPATLPITRDFLKRHTKIEYDAEDSLVDTYIAAATNYLEQYTRRRFVEQTVVEYADTFKHHFPLILDLAPVKSITEVAYWGEDASDYAALATTVYDTDLFAEPSYIELLDGQDWPDLADKRNAVKVTYVAGYGDADAVPSIIKQAIALQAASHFFEREDQRRERYMRTSLLMIQPFIRYYY